MSEGAQDKDYDGTPRRALAPRARGDHEFLPAALEILETPPAPARMRILATICAFVVTALVWGWFGRLDIIAQAQGVVRPIGRVKVTQPLDAGKVARIAVQNGAHVRAGEILVELDASAAEADVAADETDLESYEAEAARRAAGLAFVQARASSAPRIAWPAAVPLSIRAREGQVLAADLGRLAGEIASLAAQAEQKRAEQARLRATIEAQTALVETERARVAMKGALVKEAAGSRADLINTTETLQSQQTTLIEEQGQLAESRAAEAVVARDEQKTDESFIADYSEKLAEVEREADDTRQKLTKARVNLDHMSLRSPIDGTVQASTLTTIGQVLAPGQEIMRIVPSGGEIDIEAYLPGKDRGFVAEGDTAVVKIDAFPFTRYGTLPARVLKVARDAIPAPDAVQSEADSARALADGTVGGGERTQNLVYPVTLQLERTSVNIDGARQPIVPGMSVNVEIRTGSRRILEYIFSPLAETASRSMRER